MKFIGQAVAAEIDKKLMSTGAFSIDQLMELAGLSVAESFTRLFPKRSTRPVIICGPGNNGGDGLVAARHLAHFGYSPSIVYPKETKNELYLRLQAQCKQLGIKIDREFHFDDVKHEIGCFIDAIFGFGFKGEVREPFGNVLKYLKHTDIPILSVDIPSGWNVETGYVDNEFCFTPRALISLTAPKEGTLSFKGTHFIGGRFIPEWLAKEYQLTIPEYEGTSQSFLFQA